MDGPFMCIDPYGDSGFHVLGNVVHAIHSRNIGYFPIVPKGYDVLLNKGVIKNPSISKAEEFISSAIKFFPEIDKSSYIGSMFTFRTVKPNHEHDDARPTIVNLAKKNLVTIFSGKICTCLTAAKDAANQI
jgi:hypothetical protein